MGDGESDGEAAVRRWKEQPHFAGSNRSTDVRTAKKIRGGNVYSFYSAKKSFDQHHSRLRRDLSDTAPLPIFMQIGLTFQKRGFDPYGFAHQQAGKFKAEKDLVSGNVFGSKVQPRAITDVQYRRLREAGKPDKLARVAVARKLLLIAFAIFKSGEPFRSDNDNSKS